MKTVEVGRFIKEQLKSKGYTQEKLADYLGISKQAVSQNLNGRSSFETSNLMMIAEFLDISLDELLYAGSKRDTNLSKFYNMSIENISIKKAPEQPDSLGKTLLDYCIEDNNLLKFDYLYMNELIIDSLYNNIKFIAFLIRNKQYKLLKSNFRTPIKDNEGKIISYRSNPIQFPSLSETKNVIRMGSKNTPIYANLTKEQKVYVDALLQCEDEGILKLIPDLRSNGTKNRDLSILAMIALEKDNKYIFDIYITNNKYRVKKDTFDIAIYYNATEIAKYLYDNYDLKLVENLLKIDDREFVQKRITSMNLNEYQMSKGIIDAVKANDLLAVKALINIVDEKSLSLALEQADFEKGLDVAKALLDAGAEFSVINAYDSKNRIMMPSVTSAVKHLLEKFDEKDKK